MLLFCLLFLLSKLNKVYKKGKKENKNIKYNTFTKHSMYIKLTFIHTYVCMYRNKTCIIV